MQASDQMRTHFLSKLQPAGQIALNNLNKHFGAGSPFPPFGTRSHFHYKDEAELVEENFQRLSSREPWVGGDNLGEKRSHPDCRAIRGNTISVRWSATLTHQKWSSCEAPLA